MSVRLAFYLFLVLSPFLLGSEGCRRDYEFAPDASVGDGTGVNGDTPAISFVETSAAQTSGTVSVRLQLSAAASDDVTAQLGFVGTATQDLDYQVTSSEVTIPEGSTTGQFTIQILSAANEGETVVVNILSADNATIDANSQFTLTIGEDTSADDDAITVDLLETSETVAVGDSVEVTLIADDFFSSSTSVGIAVSGTASDADFTVTPSSFRFGVDDDEATVSVSTDSGATAGETIILTLSAGTGYQLGTDTQVTITLAAATSAGSLQTRSVGEAVLEGLLELQNATSKRVAGRSNAAETFASEKQDEGTALRSASLSSAQEGAASGAGNWLGDMAADQADTLLDQDGDGFSDILESSHGTDLADYNSQPTGFSSRLINRFIGIDDDLDGISNADEISYGSNPQLADSDNNSRTDGAEYLSAGAPFGGAYLDSDGDGLSDEYEASLGTSSSSRDTDLDGLSDAQELALGTAYDSKDTDGDGIFDGREVILGTDPVVAD